MLDVRGRTALVTGGGTGMGCAIARALATAGANVAIGYAHSHQEAESTAESLVSLGVRASAHRANVAQVAECESLVGGVLEAYGRLDIVVNSAGTTHFIDFGDLEGVTEAIWDEILDVNLKGAFFVNRAAARWMREHGDGRGVIVNVASTAGFGPTGSSLPYSVSKAGLVHATKALAIALAPRVRVNAVAPGLVLTRWWDRRAQQDVDRLVAGTRFQRAVAVDDVASAAMLLVGNESMSGQTIAVDLANTLH